LLDRPSIKLGVFSMPAHQLLPKAIVALRPQSSLAPCRQRFGADQRARLTFQHVEIMFEIEHLLMAFVAPFVTRD